MKNKAEEISGKFIVSCGIYLQISRELKGLT